MVLAMNTLGFDQVSLNMLIYEVKFYLINVQSYTGSCVT